MAQDIRLNSIRRELRILAFFTFCALLLGVLGTAFSADNTFTNNFKARTNRFSPSNLPGIYPVLCDNITIGSEEKTFSGTTKFKSVCGEAPDECSQYICNGENRCELVKREGEECSVSSDCPGYLEGEICNIETCTCVQLEVGGPGVIVEQGGGNVNYTFGVRFRNFGGVVQNIFIQRPDQTIAQWTKLNYNWGASRTHSVNLNWNTVTRIFTVSVVAEDDPSVNSISSHNFTELVGFNPIDSFEFIAVARSGQFLIFDELMMSSQATSPATYPGTPTFVNYYFLEVQRTDENFVFSGTIYLDGAYSGQETSKVEIAFGEHFPIGVPIDFTDFFDEINL